jgi:phytoene dehydrogenase-like protein
MAAFDDIIVGAGHNALVCALYLAKAGRRVLVLERSAAIGGALRSAELTLPGFVHDLYATNVGQFAVSPAYRDFAKEFAAAGLEFLSNPYPYATAFDVGTALRVYRDPVRTEREIAARSTADATAWRELVDLFKRTAPHFLPLFFTALPSRAAAMQAARLLAASPRSALALRRVLKDTPREFVDRRFASHEVKALLIPWAYHMDFGPDVPGGATFAFVAGLSGHLRGLSVAKGGAGAITTALHRIALSLGVEIRRSSEVKSIRIENGRAAGVVLATGESVDTTRVVASVTPRRLFGGLVADEHLPAAFRRRIGEYRYGPATFIVHLALDRALDWRAADDLAEFNYVHLCGLTEDVARTYADSLAGRLPARPVLVVSQTTPVDPSRAPPGKHVARIHVRTVPSVIADDAAGTIRARNWTEAAEPYAERLLDLVAAQAPNLRQAILARHIVTPPEIEADNPNLVGGDCVSGSHHLDQNFTRRPLRGWSRYATPIRDLFMTGAATWPGGGVHGGSGYLVAQKLLRSNGS